MSVPAKLAAFAVALALAFGAGVAIGAAVGPLDDGGSARDHRGPPATAPPAAGADPAERDHGGR